MMHPARQHGRGPLRGLRRNAVLLVLAIAALIVYLGAHYLRGVVMQRTWGGSKGDIMALPTCAARLAALGVLPEDADGLGGVQVSMYTTQRHALYQRMAEDVEAKGLALGGVITQGLKQDDLFHITVLPPEQRRRRLSLVGPRAPGVTIEPVLKPLQVPVRAVILPLLDSRAAWHIGQQVTKLLLPAVPDGGVWVQDPQLFHATVFHASSHLLEHQQIVGVASRTCPVKAVLERVIVTSSGVVVACWQPYAHGGEPALLRQALSEALPDAPPKEAQAVREPAMLHTTLARLLRAPAADGSGQGAVTDAQAVAVAVQQLSDALCGLEADFNELWFVEEQDLLALALQGHYVKHPAPLVCPPQA